MSVEGWAKEPIGRVSLRDVDVEFTGGGTAEQAAAQVKSPGVDARPLPAWGLYVRNVKRLDLDNVRLGVEQDDARPAVIAEDVGTLALDQLRLPAGAKPPVLRNVGNVVQSRVEWQPKTESANEKHE
jgi:hypothetical protein